MIVNQPKLFIALCLLLISGNAFAQCVVGVTCPPNIVTVADSGTCGAIASYASPTATNSCTIAGTVTFNYTAPALQTFTVPTGVTSINIDASGAQGGSVTVSCPATGGLGARMQGDFAVTPGEGLSIMVGQAGLTNGSDAGGGGGTFVVRTGNVLLVAAGGGGGATNDIGQCRVLGNGSDASITTTRSSTRSIAPRSCSSPARRTTSSRPGCPSARATAVAEVATPVERQAVHSPLRAEAVEARTTSVPIKSIPQDSKLAMAA